jgi:hypothetical protein
VTRTEPPKVEPVPGQLALPLDGLAEPPAAPQGKRRKVTYTRIRPAQRTSCEDCRRALHRDGIARAPLPRPARWRRTDPSGETDLLCQPCKKSRTEAERC